MIVLIALEASNDIFKVAPSTVSQNWIYDSILVASTVLILARAVYEPVGRKAWLCFGMATASWAIGTISWWLVYGGERSPPYPTFSDIFWLLWYPLMALGIIFLIRVSVPHFELHRWMDGLAVALLVLAVGFALIIQPLAEHTGQSLLATAVNFSYPVFDLLLLGAILGVYALLGWHPDRMWLFLGLAVLTTTIPDAVQTIQQAHGVVVNGSSYSFVWSISATSAAFAAWVPARGVSDGPPVTGLRAVILPLAAQALAIGIQISAVVEPIGTSERIVTVVVLIIASVQILLTRPRAQQPEKR